MHAGYQIFKGLVRSSAARARKGPYLRRARSGGKRHGGGRAELLSLAGKVARRRRFMTIQPGLALVFDMDGVILDSNPTHREAWRAYNRRFGIETDEAMQQRMYGKRNDEIVRDFFGAALTETEVAAHGAAKESLFREMIGPRLNEFLVPGLTDILRSAASMPIGTPMGLSTTA